MSYKQAAEVSDVPVGTIMSRLARARVALQAKLEEAKLEVGGHARRSRNDAEAE
jgi:RNA polymerase sigma-70 factor (ECF subfamily)